jgi:hypothetical protein
MYFWWFSCKCRDFISGHEKVWHGDIDIVFSSHHDIPECITKIQVLPECSEVISEQSSPDTVMHTPKKRRIHTEGDYH